MELSLGKLAVYLLTFSAYIYTGYGSGLLTNLRDAVLTAENLFGDVFKNVITVANNFKSVHDIFSAAVEENCIFKCPVEGVIPKPNRNHKATANGCGSLGVEIDAQYLPVNEMTKCCDAHDICYDTCNTDKEVCDMEFKRCLYRYCDMNQSKIGDTMVKACKGAAKLLFTATTTLGCKPFMDAQSQACYCAPSSREFKKEKKFTKGGGEL